MGGSRGAYRPWRHRAGARQCTQKKGSAACPPVRPDESVCLSARRHEPVSQDVLASTLTEISRRASSQSLFAITDRFGQRATAAVRETDARVAQSRRAALRPRRRPPRAHTRPVRAGPARPWRGSTRRWRSRRSKKRERAYSSRFRRTGHLPTPPSPPPYCRTPSPAALVPLFRQLSPRGKGRTVLTFSDGRPGPARYDAAAREGCMGATQWAAGATS